MNRFHFALESVAALRRHEEKQAFDRLVVAQGKAAEEQGRLNELIREWERLSLAEVSMKSLVAGDLELRRSWLKITETRVQEQGRRVRTAEAAVAKHRATWLLARRNLEALERLRELRYSAHCEAQARIEQKELDEIAQQTHLARTLLAKPADERV
ncbi:MAG: hypothetical protein FJ405_11565 [Verrucomicrobia bacterium]|nr:hypothetical protein [Verrucomicrobiota bacterium]